VLGVLHSVKAQAYRRKAATCQSYAACAQSGADRERLLRMRDGCLRLAANQDRLDGLPPIPPVAALALAVPA
jgi:hypothetical protein